MPRSRKPKSDLTHSWLSCLIPSLLAHQPMIITSAHLIPSFTESHVWGAFCNKRFPPPHLLRKRAVVKTVATMKLPTDDTLSLMHLESPMKNRHCPSWPPAYSISGLLNYSLPTITVVFMRLHSSALWLFLAKSHLFCISGGKNSMGLRESTGAGFPLSIRQLQGVLPQPHLS